MPRKVAITGFAFRFPGTDREHYWQDLLEGRNLVTEVAADRWARESYLHPSKSHPGTSYTFAAGSLGDVSQFDAGYFGISPREASLMDPQQRLLLELSAEALENSGIPASTVRGTGTGVFIGIASADYSFRLADDLAAVDSSVATGNTGSIAANRISYVFDLRGPSMAIDTACSSALVAFHQAVRSIASGESPCALAGGVSLHLHPYGFIAFSKASMLSRQGRCAVFDASGDGYVRSEGGGVFVLKDYDLAVADGNPILAVVASSAVNADGRKSGLTVPSYKAQAALMERACAEAGIEPTAIDYVEAHGTGTPVGDPIEARAIGEALGQRRPKDSPIPIGSVKSNLGHLEAASGVAGLVKALHCVQHRLVPATIGITDVNPNIRTGDWNVDIVTQNRELKRTGKVVVGVNSFGFGGANAHVILESHAEPNRPTLSKLHRGAQLPVVVSAKDATALRSAAREMAAFVRELPEASFYDAAHSTVFRREWHPHRAIAFGATPDAVAQSLQDFADDAPSPMPVTSGVAIPNASGPAFLYSGNGSQWAEMGRRLLAEEPLFREAVREVDVHFLKWSEWSCEAELEGMNGADRYAFTEIAQPALFALQVGVTKMLRHRGIEPVAVAGHSVGEVAAAWAAGALTLEQAVEVVYHRSRLQGTTKGQGAMTAVGADAVAVARILEELGLTDRVSLAGANGPRGATLAGPADLLGRVETLLADRNVFFKRLDLDYAFHSPAMDAIEKPLRDALAKLRAQPGNVRFHSAVTGAVIPGNELDATYWWRNIRQPVLFEAAVGGMIAEGTSVFVEIGPHAVLRGYVRDMLKQREVAGTVIATMLTGDGAPHRVWSAGSQAAIAGARVDWDCVFPWAGRFVPLPNYPWQRERHWHPVTAESMRLLERRKIHPLLGYPVPAPEPTWENRFDTHLHAVLADHVVGDATVLPGSAYAEIALAAGILWHGGQRVEVEDLEIRAPLLLDDTKARLVRVTIAPADGTLTVLARDQDSGDPWTVHAVARLLHEPFAADDPPAPTTRPERDADFDADAHEALMRSAGLAYGPAFRCVSRGWVEDGLVVAELEAPAALAEEITREHLHPALLDCTLQLIVQLLPDEVASNPGTAYVPVKMGRIRFQAGRGTPALAHARLLHRNAHSLTGEFHLYDAAGEPIASVQDVVLRRISLRKSAADRLRFVATEGTPKPHPLGNGHVVAIEFEAVQAALGDVVRRAALKGSHRRYSEEVDPLLDSLCSRFTAQALRQFSPDGKVVPDGTLQARQLATPAIAPYLQHLLALAREDRTIERSGEGWRLAVDEDGEASAQDIWNRLVADYPDFFQIVHSVGRAGMHLPAVLAGQPASRLPESLRGALMRQALGAENQRRMGRAVREVIAAALASLPDGRRLSILEVSEGAPSFATDICGSLDYNRCDYRYAGGTPAAVDSAERLLERFPSIATGLIDEGQDAHAQLALVTGDFATLQHATRAIEYARANLAPGGTLVFVGLHPSRWIDFVFGAEPDGWFESADGASLSSQRPLQFWQRHLQQLGLTCAAPLELSPDTLSGPYLLLGRIAEGSAEHSPPPRLYSRNWILLANESSPSARLANALAKKLLAHGDRVSQACPGDATQIEALLRHAEADGKLDGIVHLAGLTGQDELEPAAMLASQVERCSSIAALVQACEASKTTAPCWIVTSGAALDLLPPRRHRQRLHAPIADAAVWGFAHSLMNEPGGLSVRLVDLEDPSAIKTAVTALDRELENADEEHEVVITAAGERFAPRLRLEPRPDVAPEKAEPAEPPALRLGFQFPGQLRNLRWEEHAAQAPGENEVEVEVHATGLNFRDVMFALGLLSDEAIAGGFAGASLGIEFSGVVRRVGARAKGFKTGDPVLGFAASSFGTRLVTPASAIAHMPPGISFEAAATIPCTFLTAYYSLHHLAKVREGEKVLIHGAAGGVGLAAIQVAKWIGAEIYATAGSDEKRDFLRMLGVDHIYDSRSLAFADGILADTDGQGVDVVLNSLAGEAVNRNLRVLKRFGRFLELGKQDFYENTKIGLRPFRNNISYFGIDADQLMQERPDLTRELFSEVIGLFEVGALHPLPYQAFEADDVIDAFRYMQQAKQIGKVVITYRNGIRNPHGAARAPQERLALRADGSYLVTGGLAGFGLRTAEWLADRGARHLALISLSGPVSEEARQGVARLRARGVEVLAAACDVTDWRALSGLVAEIGAKMPPLRGVVHAAAVYDDGLIRSMDAEKIRRVMAPKVLGAQYLHQVTLGMPLDLFVLFSSATTLFGNPGQGNYVAANSWLEALARQRRNQGLPAVCIRWGAIEDAGFLARNEKIRESLQGRMGGAALPAAVALDALETLLLADRSGLGVLEFEWRALARFLPSAGEAKFAELARLAGENETAESGAEDIQRLLAELPEAELHAAFVEMIKSDVGEILRVSPDKVDATRSLYDIGLDSLMGVELVTALESRFGLRLPVMALGETPTIASLAGRIIAMLRKAEEVPAQGTAQATAQEVQQLVAQHDAQVTQESIARFAAEIAEQKGENAGRMIQ